jgi:hypothetical protein
LFYLNAGCRHEDGFRKWCILKYPAWWPITSQKRGIFFRNARLAMKAEVDFITSEMQKEGLDLNNEENLDSYLNRLT